MALKFAMSSHFPLPKISPSLFRLSQMAQAAPSFFSSKKWIKLILKTIGNRKKRLCVRLRSEDKHHLRKSADRKAQIRKAFFLLTGLICAFWSANFLRWCLSSKRNLTHNLSFLFPIDFSIYNLFQWWFFLGNHNYQANLHIHQQHNYYCLSNDFAVWVAPAFIKSNGKQRTKTNQYIATFLWSQN